MAAEVWRDVRSVLVEGGVDALPVKGLVTARWLYDRPEEREISDIDIRVRPGDLRRVRELGTRAGWSCVHVSRVYGQVTFTIAGLDVDIESSCGPPGYVALSIDDMLRRSALGASPALAALGPVPEIHDHALLLVVNAVKDHLIDAAKWALDDLRRVVRAPGFDDTMFLGRAREAAALGMVLLVSGFLDQDDRWRALGQRIRPRPTARLYDNLYKWIIRTPGPRWAIRVGARLASDGYLRPALSLVRAAALIGEQRWQAAWAPNRGGALGS